MEVSRPPASPRAALLSSPSRLKKYEDYRNPGSPLKRPSATPKLYQDNRRVGLSKQDNDIENIGEEDDEETLRLKLAAIETRLKLKKLQESKSKLKKAEDALIARSGQMEVPVSPIKRPAPLNEPKSPSRVLLGIDKGFKGIDVSLRRARSLHATAPSLEGSKTQRTQSRVSVYSSIRTKAPPVTSMSPSVKSFSQRLAESREKYVSKENKRVALESRRSTKFKLDCAELEKFRSVAESGFTQTSPRSPNKDRRTAVYSREDVLASQTTLKSDTSLLQRSETLPNLRSSPERDSTKPPRNENTPIEQNLGRDDSPLYEPFSQLHLSSRILPHSFLQRTLPSETHTPMRIPYLLKHVHSPAFELPDSIIDYVVFGIVASKSSPYDHKFESGSSNLASTVKAGDDWEKRWDDGGQNKKKFMILQLTDLTWTIDLYLFGTALPRYHRLSPGTVVAILNPGIMPPKKGKEDTGVFSLTLHSGEDTVLEIGTARDLGFCKAIKKDGKACESWVNCAKVEYCDWHLHVQVDKTKAGRMGVNTGSNSFGPGGRGAAGQGMKGRFHSLQERTGRWGSVEAGGLLPREGGQRFDRATGSHYYIASSGGTALSGGSGTPIYQPDRNAANLLDLNDEDPFIAEGQLSRDKESRLRKRLVAQEREREIARNLGAKGSSGAGGEDMRHRAGISTSSADLPESQAKAAKAGIMAGTGLANANRKRTAASVRLSPVKKTRLLTEKGILVPGRESLGAKHSDANGHDDNDDDDLVIV